MKKIIYSSDYWDYKGLGYCVFDDNDNEVSIDEAIDKNMWGDLEFFVEGEYNYLKELCEGCCGGNVESINYFIVDGYFEGWRGRQNGGLVSNKSLIDLLSDLCVNACQSDMKVYIEDNTLYLENAHHDGCSRYRIKALTKKGEQWYYNHEYDDRKSIVEHLMNTRGYTKNVKFWD